MEAERVFADTNLFLRYLTNDVPAQADAVEQLLHTILNTPGLEAAEGDLLLQAISWYAEYADKNIDFIDAFNAAWLAARGLTTVYSFDLKHFSRCEFPPAD